MKQQQQQQDQPKTSYYDSEPRLSNVTSVHNRYYSSMNDFQQKNVFPSIRNQECDVSYEVDSPRLQQTNDTSSSSVGYLNAFLLKKRQQKQANCMPNVQQLIAQFEQPKSTISTPTMTRRPVSAPLIDLTMKPTKGILQRRINGTVTPVSNKSSRKRSKSVTFECHEDEINNTSSTDDDKINYFNENLPSPRINIGITLDSRLRKTPVLDMLRSTTMEIDILESKQINTPTSMKQPFLPMARF